MELVPLVSINYNLTISREETADALKVIRLWGNDVERWNKKWLTVVDWSDWGVRVGLYCHVRFKSHDSTTIQQLTLFRLRRSQCSPATNYNSSLRCAVKTGSEWIAQITDSAANRCIDGLCECCAFHLLYFGDQSPQSIIKFYTQKAPLCDWKLYKTYSVKRYIRIWRFGNRNKQ